MSAADKLKSWAQRPVQYLGSEWNRMAPRERRLVMALGTAVCAFAMIVGGFLLVDSLQAIDESNDDAREALAAIAKHRDEYLEAKSRMVAQEVRIGNEPPQLAADLEAAAREAGLQIAETTPRPVQPAGKRYVEHQTDVTLRQVGLKELATFLSRAETGRRLIMITRLHVKRRFSEGEKMDAQLSAIAFEKVKEPPKKRPTPAAAKGSGT